MPSAAGGTRCATWHGDDFADGTLRVDGASGSLSGCLRETHHRRGGPHRDGYALPVSTSSRMMRMSASPMPGFSLQDHQRASAVAVCGAGRAAWQLRQRMARSVRSPVRRYGVCDALPGRIHGLLSGAYAAVGENYLRRRPAATGRMSSWTWIRTVPIPAIPPSSITKAPCTPSAGCFVTSTRSWSSTMTRTMKPGRARCRTVRHPAGHPRAGRAAAVRDYWTTSTAPADRLPACIWNTRAGLRPTASPARP